VEEAMRKPRESDVLAQCLAALNAWGIPAWRNNTGGLPVQAPSTRVKVCGQTLEVPGKRRFLRFGKKGSSDILGVLPPEGRFLAVETKRPGEKPTPEQVAFLDMISAAGGLALVISDVKQLEAALRLEGVI